MNDAAVILGFFFCLSGLHAEQITKATGSIIRAPGRIQTGSSSRIELELPYLALARVGSNATLRFGPAPGDLALDGGTLMLSSPKGSRELVVRTPSVVASMKGGTLQMANVSGQVKVIGLDGKVITSIAARPKERVALKPGQMVVIAKGAAKMPAPTTINLKMMLSTSILLNMGPFPGRAAIEKNAGAQEPKHSFRIGGLFSPDIDPSIGLAATAMQTNAILAQETAIAATQQQQAQQVAQQAQQTAQQAQQAQQAAQAQQQAAAARQAADTAIRLAAARQLAEQQRLAQQQQTQQNQGNQGNAFGPGGNPNQGNQGQGNNGNQGQGNNGQGNQGQGNPGQGNQPP